MQDPKLTIPYVATLIKRYYMMAGNDMGGSLHIWTVDRNCRLLHLESCREFAIERGDVCALEILDRALRMTASQRRKISGMGFYAWDNWVKNWPFPAWRHHEGYRLAVEELRKPIWFVPGPGGIL